MASDRRKILRAIKREGRYIKDPHQRRVYLKAAVETGLVETNLTNPQGGDADSGGWRQERRSLYANPTNIGAAARRFREEFQQQYNPGEKSYQVAAQVQRPRADLRGRYKDRAGEASAILRGSAGPGSTPNTMQGASYKTVPGVDNSQQRTALKLAYLQDSHNPQAILDLALGLRGAQDTPGRRVKVKAPGNTSTSSGRSDQSSGVADFEGTKVAAWIKPALQYAREHGWQGQVTSGYRTRAEQTRIYQSGVRPAARPGTSNHEGTDFPRGAVDVSDAQALARILRGSRYGRKLRWAGAKDPVHFSNPHGGSY